MRRRIKNLDLAGFFCVGGGVFKNSKKTKLPISFDWSVWDRKFRLEEVFGKSIAILTPTNI